MLTTVYGRLRESTVRRFEPVMLLDARLGWALAVVGTIVAAAAALTPPVRHAGVADAVPVGAALAILVGMVALLCGAGILVARRAVEQADHADVE